MAALSDRLRDIGNLDHIRKKGDKIGMYLGGCKTRYSLNREGFQLWDMFYCENMGRINPSAKEPYYTSDPILKTVLEKYTKEVWEGGHTTRIMLNHAVTGGLMLLQASTFCYQFMWGLESIGWEDINRVQEKKRESGIIPISGDFVSKETFELIKETATALLIPAHSQIRGDLKFTSWLKDLWATAAVAIHDYVTLDDWNEEENEEERDPHDKDKYGINLDQDPLAYLEVLVDLLQEWDRYSVLGETAFSDEELLQSNEVFLGVGKEFISLYAVSLDLSLDCEHMDVISVDSVSENKIYVRYPKRRGPKDYKKNLIDKLEKALIDWEEYVNIDTISPHKVR